VESGNAVTMTKQIVMSVSSSNAWVSISGDNFFMWNSHAMEEGTLGLAAVLLTLSGAFSTQYVRH
jgi:hypothetical protein